MQCKLQVETPSEYTYSLIWAELSRLLGEKIPVAIVGLEPGTPGSVVQRFNHLVTKQPSLAGSGTDCHVSFSYLHFCLLFLVSTLRAKFFSMEVP